MNMSKNALKRKINFNTNVLLSAVFFALAIASIMESDLSSINVASYLVSLIATLLWIWKTEVEQFEAKVLLTMSSTQIDKTNRLSKYINPTIIFLLVSAIALGGTLDPIPCLTLFGNLAWLFRDTLSTKCSFLVKL